MEELKNKKQTVQLHKIGDFIFGSIMGLILEIFILFIAWYVPFKLFFGNYPISDAQRRSDYSFRILGFIQLFIYALALVLPVIFFLMFKKKDRNFVAVGILLSSIFTIGLVIFILFNLHF